MDHWNINRILKSKQNEIFDPSLDEASERVYDIEAKSSASLADLGQKELARSLARAKRVKYYFPVKGKPSVCSYSKIWDLYSDMPDGKDRMLFITLYCLGGRVSEIINLRKMDFIYGVDDNYGEYIQATLLTEKKKSMLNTTRELRLFFEQEKTYCEDIWNFIGVFGEDNFIFPQTSRRQAWRKIKKIDFGPIRVIKLINKKREIIIREKFPGFPHFLRHCRLTHLLNDFHFSMPALVAYAGWQNYEMAKTYVHTTTKEQGRGFFGR